MLEPCVKTNKWRTEKKSSLFSRSVCCYRRPANAKTVVLFDKIGCLERSRKFNSHVTTSGLIPRRKLINGLKHTNQRFGMIAFLNVSDLNFQLSNCPHLWGFFSHVTRLTTMFLYDGDFVPLLLIFSNLPTHHTHSSFLPNSSHTPLPLHSLIPSSPSSVGHCLWQMLCCPC